MYNLCYCSRQSANKCSVHTICIWCAENLKFYSWIIYRLCRQLVLLCANWEKKCAFTHLVWWERTRDFKVRLFCLMEELVTCSIQLEYCFKLFYSIAIYDKRNWIGRLNPVCMVCGSSQNWFVAFQTTSNQTSRASRDGISLSVKNWQAGWTWNIVL